MNFQTNNKMGHRQPYNHEGKKMNQPEEDCMGRFKFCGLSKNKETGEKYT
jgi:hypothetical protein